MIKNRRKQWFGYSFIGAGFLVLYVALFPTIQQQSADYQKILDGLPKGVMSAFNITNSSTSLMGYLSSKHFGLVWALMIVFLMTSYGGLALAREIETRTMGFLLSLPISRTKLYLSRWTTGLIGLAIFIVCSEVLVWPLAAAFGFDASLRDTLNIGLLGFLFGFAILGMSLLLSAALSEGGKVTAYLSTTLLVMYVMFLVASLEPRLQWLQYVSVFHYFAPGNVITDGYVSLGSFLFLLGLGAVAGSIGLAVFRQRDIAV